VIVRDGVITDVAPAHTRIPAKEASTSAFGGGALVVTLPDDETLLPGLIDSHNHPALCADVPDYLLRMDDPYEQLFLRALRNFQLTLGAGVTTVRCLGERGFVDVLYRQAVEEGLALGPRIKTCTRGFRTERGHGFLATPIATVEALQHGLVENARMGADFAKLFVTGTVLIDGVMPSFLTRDEIQMAVETAHGLGHDVTVHAVGGQGLHDCLDAGVDCIEHGYFIDDAAIAKIRARDAWLVITSGVFFDDEAVDNHHSQETRDAFRAQRAIVRDCLAGAVSAGLNIAAGTDGLVGKLANEVRFLTEIGMTPLQAVRAATVQGARLLHLDDTIGSLTVGKRADIISVRGNPAEDISALTRVHLVMKDGVRLDPLLDQMSTLVPSPDPLRHEGPQLVASLARS
jgi:imidazolonepropionase-like amidohydrolase